MKVYFLKDLDERQINGCFITEYMTLEQVKEAIFLAKHLAPEDYDIYDVLNNLNSDVRFIAVDEQKNVITY